MLWEGLEGKRKHLYKWTSRFGRRRSRRMFYGQVSDTGMHFHAVSIIPLWCGCSAIVVLLWHHHRNITEPLQGMFVGGPIKGYFPKNSVGRSQDKGWGHLEESGPERLRELRLAAILFVVSKPCSLLWFTRFLRNRLKVMTAMTLSRTHLVSAPVFPLTQLVYFLDCEREEV